ncbi:MAG: peptidoglycan DD-metalloendopeptidase family protein [Lachnospiraceae bacterium]|nr:peptidoglycan DD-metalloendopeptidase family protein [Lachnospiraceae bacterium]
MKKRIYQALCFLLLILILVPAGSSGTYMFGAKKESSKNSEGEEGSSSSSYSGENLTNESIRKKEAEVKDAEQNRATLKSGSDSARSEINALSAAQDQVMSDIRELDRQSDETQNELDRLRQSISENELRIVDAENDVKEAKDDVKTQYEDMKKRIRFMYEAGDQAFAELLFSSEDFGQFLNRSEYIKQIQEYDERKLKEFAEARAKLEAALKNLEKEEESLQKKAEEEEAEKEKLDSLIDEKAGQVEKYESLIGDREALIKEYESMIAAETAQIAALEAAIKAEKAALAEEQRRKYDGGKFAFPAPDYTRVSDDYGMRMHPTLGVEMMHNGIDLAAPSGSPVLAAYDGKVIAADYSPSMGNYIMLDHGDDLISIYMHCSSLGVSAGQEVSRGDRIAAVGSTGRSTGPHLHFGVRQSGSYVSPWKYLKK